MLMQRHKDGMRGAMETVVKLGGQAAFADLAKAGPTHMVQMFIDDFGGHVSKEELDNLIENRKEAEQYLAGLLGMA